MSSSQVLALPPKYRKSIYKGQEILDDSGLAFLYHSQMEIKEWVKGAREKAGLTQEQLGEELGCTKGNISAWENGRHDPSWAQILRMAEISGLPVPADFNFSVATQTRAQYQIPANRYKEVPVYGKGFGGPPEGRSWTDGDYPPGTSDKFAEIATSDPNAFLTEIEEGSMSPRYNPGEFALIEPNTVPELGDDVFVKLKNDGTCLKRLLSRRDGYIRLGSYNTTEILTYKEEDIEWVYYVAHFVPRKKIKSRI